MKESFLLISHGSRSVKAQGEVLKLTKSLKKKAHAKIFECAFLDVSQPDIPTGINACIKQGATRIIVLLNFLNSGEHAVKDIPRLINAALKDFPQISVFITQPIGQHADIPKLFLEVICESSRR